MAATTTGPWPINQDVIGTNFEDSSDVSSRVAHVYIGVISVLGLMLNILVIAVIVILQDYKKSRQWYVLNLAVAHGLFLVMLMVAIHGGLTRSWALGVPACVAFQGGFCVNHYAGIMILAVMSFDLYIAVAHPTSPSWAKFRSTQTAVILALLVWGIGVAAAIPIMMNTFVYDNVCDFSFDYIHPVCQTKGIQSVTRCEIFMSIEYQELESPALNDTNLENIFADGTFLFGGSGMDYDFPNYKFDEDYQDVSEWIEDKSDVDCFPDISKEHSTWIVIDFVLVFVIPFAVMICCLCGILYRLHNPNSDEAPSRTGSTRSDNEVTSPENQKEDGIVRRIIFVTSLVVTFAVCWSPIHGVFLSRLLGTSLTGDSCYTLHNAAILIAYSNSFLNPVLYILLDGNFREKLQMSMSRIRGKTLTDRRDCSTKKDIADSTKLPASNHNVPLRTLASNMTCANNEIVDVEAQTVEEK